MLQLSVITPEQTVYDGQVDQVTIPTIEGEITVLPHHVPLVGIIAPGELRIRQNGNDVPLVIAGGFVEVLPPELEGLKAGRPESESVTRVAILADAAERVEALDVAAIEAARERARQALATKRAGDDVSFADAAAAMQRELARLRVARKYHKSGVGGQVGNRN